MGRRVSFAPPAQLDEIREYQKNAQEWDSEPLKITKKQNQSNASAASSSTIVPYVDIENRAELPPALPTATASIEPISLDDSAFVSNW